MKFRYRKLGSASILAVFMLPSALAQTSHANKFQAFGEPYREAPPVASDQAQIIYFRPRSETPKAVGANVYVDGHFHAALLPGGFTTFCLQPGQHMLGAFQNDAPLYRGKTEVLYRVNLEAGKTYFVKVSEEGNGLPVSVTREEAEQSLRATREQTHAISRAGTPTCTS